jgi:hypothetical protein
MIRSPFFHIHEKPRMGTGDGKSVKDLTQRCLVRRTETYETYPEIQETQETDHRL